MKRDVYIGKVKKGISSISTETEKIREMEKRILSSSEKSLQWITEIAKRREVYEGLIKKEYGYDIRKVALIGPVPAKEEQEDFLRGLADLVEVYYFLNLCLETVRDSFKTSTELGESSDLMVKTAVKEIFKLRKALPTRTMRKLIFERVFDLPPAEEDLFKATSWVRLKIGSLTKRERLMQSVNGDDDKQNFRETLLEMLPAAVVLALWDCDLERDVTIDKAAKSIINAATQEIAQDKPVLFNVEKLLPQSKKKLEKKFDGPVEGKQYGLVEGAKLMKSFEEREHARINLKEFVAGAKLAHREIELLELLLKTPDASGADLAEQMKLSKNTVYVLKKRLKDKVLKLNTRK